MTRGEAWLHHAANLLVGGSGLAYGWMLYLVPEDPFSMANHPLQPEVQALHILSAPLLVLGLGLIWRNHVWLRFRRKYPFRRKTGITLMLLALPMVGSGYLLQVTADELWHLVWIWIHGLSSSLWILIYLVHQFTRPTPRAKT